MQFQAEFSKYVLHHQIKATNTYQEHIFFIRVGLERTEMEILCGGGADGKYIFVV